MPELLNGDGTIPAATSGWVQHVISSSTNASPIAVTFCAAHCAIEGDNFEIEGHQTNTNANGNWRVHVTGTNTLQLLGSTGNGVGGNTGYGIDYSVNPLLQVADDGDAASASNLNTTAEGLANFVPYLYKRAGQFRIYNIYSDEDTRVDPPVAHGTLTSVTNDSAWHLITGTSFAYPFYVAAGDQITIQMDSLLLTSAAGAGVLAVGLGVSQDGGVTWSLLGGARYLGLSTSSYQSISLFVHQIEGMNLGSVRFGVVGYNSSGGAQNFTIYSPWQLVVSHYRSNA